VCSLHAFLPCKPHFENTLEAARVEGENPDDGAPSQVNQNSNVDNDDGNNELDDGDEDDMGEVVSKLVPSRISLAKRSRELIHLINGVNSF